MKLTSEQLATIDEERRKRDFWSDEDVERLRRYYQITPDSDFSLERLAAYLGRTFVSVALKASKLGLTGSRTDSYTPSDSHIRNITIAQRERAKNHPEDSAGKSLRMKKWHSENPHPRGNTGGTHTEEVRQRIGDGVRKAWADPEHKFNSPEFRSALTDRNRRLAQSRTSVNTFSRCRKGERQDIPGICFRSSWEANYARYLNWRIKLKDGVESWEYETETFWFDKIKRGCRSYKPDFKVFFSDGRVEYHEVKGWLYPRSKTALKRMRKYHPKVTVVLIDQSRYSALSKQLKSIIPNWE